MGQRVRRMLRASGRARILNPGPRGFLVILIHCVLPLDQVCRHRYQVSEETFGALMRAGSKVEFRCRSLVGIEAVDRRAVGRTDAPDTVDRDRLSIFILEQTIEFARRQIVCGDESGQLG